MEAEAVRDALETTSWMSHPQRTCEGWCLKVSVIKRKLLVLRVYRLMQSEAWRSVINGNKEGSRWND